MDLTVESRTIYIHGGHVGGKHEPNCEGSGCRNKVKILLVEGKKHAALEREAPS
jgi:hypothetical protein